ncbi:MAG: NADPH:quinone reductase [Planctomycetia bacterium]|nr:NADPH:quinone reductase [Planctomycetia bacterium]
MRAAAYTHTGPPEVIKISDLPEPLVQPNDILVQISHSALNPIDLYIRAGTINATLPNPFIPHADFAGTVKAVGSKVTRFRIGDKVWGSNQGMMGRQGTAAELASLNEDWAYPLPETVSPADAAACALTGITAHLGLFRTGQLQPGETVFVHGGTGGVGSMVIQMAKAHGSKVITTTGNSAKMELCKSWGADLVLNYKTDDLAKAIKDFTNNQGVDLWYETQRDPNFEMILPLMKIRGRVVVIAGRAARPALPFGIFYVRDLSIRGFAMFNATPDEQRVCATEMNQWMKTGKLKACIGKTFPLDQTAAAHQLLEENTLHGAGTLTGKVVIQVS